MFYNTNLQHFFYIINYFEFYSFFNTKPLANTRSASRSIFPFGVLGILNGDFISLGNMSWGIC